MYKSLMAVPCVIVAASLFGLTGGQPGGQPARQQEGQPDMRPNEDMGRMLINGLRASPGCLGVDAGSMNSGKQTIIAWFENKKAVTAWYYHPVHRGFMQAVGGNADDSKPLQHVENENTPIMVIASITPEAKPGPGKPPFSQISIELYAPLPGGAHVNGRLAPETFEVPHMRALGG